MTARTVEKVEIQIDISIFVNDRCLPCSDFFMSVLFVFFWGFIVIRHIDEECSIL